MKRDTSLNTIFHNLQFIYDKLRSLSEGSKLRASIRYSFVYSLLFVVFLFS